MPLPCLSKPVFLLKSRYNLNIIQEIRKGHSRELAIKISEYASASSDRFHELMDCFLSNEYRIAQRAAWAVSIVATKHPSLIQPYIKVLVAQIGRKDVHNAVVRNSLRILQDVEIAEEFHGDVLNACFSFIEDPKILAAVKAFSLTILQNMSKYYPEIKAELKLIIEERWETETPAFKSRATKILLDKN